MTAPNPIEIISDALADAHDIDMTDELYARAVVRALEAAGFRLMHVDNLTEEMRLSFRDYKPPLLLDGESIIQASQRIQKEKIAAIIAVAPLYGEKK